MNETNDPDPFKLFRQWMRDARATGMHNPNAMALATSMRDQPSVRMVLLKAFDERGLTFYTNYGSRKARDIADNPRAATVLYWRELERQVRISGVIKKVARAQSARYFHSRARESQLGAWASAQSAPLHSRRELEERVEVLRKKYAGRSIPLPPLWGGYRLVPDTFEFWSGKEGRLHDRIEYRRKKKSGWSVERLSP